MVEGCIVPGMRTHGWGGQPPSSDADALQRIHDATRRCIDRLGAKTTLSDVARELGVTRQTVYRYFPSTEALLSDTAAAASTSFLDRLGDHLAPFGDDPSAVAVEAVAFTVEQLPEEPYLGLLLQPEQLGAFGPQMTSDTSRVLARTVIDRFPVDWRSRGVDEDDLDEMAEFLLRIIQTFVLDQGADRRDPQSLRRYLFRWVGPAVTARCEGP